MKRILCPIAILCLTTLNVRADDARSLAARTANFTTGTDAAVRFGVHEIVLTGDGGGANPFDTFAAVKFVPPSSAKQAKTVQAFLDGGDTWRARVYASESGEWKWSSGCTSDKGLDGKTGTFKAADSKLRGRLFINPKNHRQWMTEDGRWFLNLALPRFDGQVAGECIETWAF